MIKARSANLRRRHLLRPAARAAAGLLLAILFLPGVVPAARAQGQVIVDSHPQLFATLCALHAAGFEANLSDLHFHPVRSRLRAEMLRLQGPAVEELREFYRRHELSDPAATLSRYVSFALVMGPPPNFELKVRRDMLPPDALALEGFNEVLARFYREAEIQKVWLRARPEYDQETRRVQAAVAEIVLVGTGYLRELLSPSVKRKFGVYIEPLIGGRTNFRSYADDYSIVLTPSRELPVDEIRHAFLHFLLDPLALRYPAATARARQVLPIAVQAPRLPVEFHRDFPALLTECLVKAVELRLNKLSGAALDAALNAAERDGYLLVRALHQQLITFENSAPAMSFYFPALMDGISVEEELVRLQKVQFAAAAQAAPAAAEPAVAPAERELARALLDGERRIAGQQPAEAEAIFAAILEKHPGHPRALYGLGVSRILQGEADGAKEIFRRLLYGDAADAAPAAEPPGAPAAASPDPHLLAWSHVYLGRIYDVEGQRELALSEYRAALAVAGAPEPAIIAARRGLEKGFEPSANRRGPGEKN